MTPQPWNPGSVTSHSIHCQLRNISQCILTDVESFLFSRNVANCAKLSQPGWSRTNLVTWSVPRKWIYYVIFSLHAWWWSRCKLFWHLEIFEISKSFWNIFMIQKKNLNLQIDIIPLKNSSFDLLKQDSRILYYVLLSLLSREVQETTGSWISFSLKPIQYISECWMSRIFDRWIIFAAW